jgi:S-methylmethionine-dependent homocysteine/selenocysteine methylase
MASAPDQSFLVHYPGDVLRSAMDFELNELLESHPLILAEAAIAERLRRMDGVTLHPTLFNAPMIYVEHAGKLMAALYSEYVEIARSAGVPILLAAPTWRLDRERIHDASVPDTINRDAVAYMRRIRAKSAYNRAVVGALLGPRKDCYDPQAALAADEAEEFHQWQANELASAGAEYLLAQTIPAISEAEGMARAIIATGVPSIISFCINRSGKVLDGCPLDEAIARIDETTGGALTGYMVNCSHPTFLHPEKMDASALRRLIGFDANASSMDHQELEGSSTTRQDSREDWVEEMLKLNKNHGVKILGGCCGTDDSYLRGLVADMNKPTERMEYEA